MNIMRKLRSSTSTPASAAANSATGGGGSSSAAATSGGGVGGGGNVNSSSAPPSARSLESAASTTSAFAMGGGTTDSPPDSPHTQLGLMHLKKLFNEYSHPREPLNESERDFKLYNMLPLFCKVFGASHSADMSEKFWDILSFAQQVSRLMVAEIRRRASNQSTEAASIAIVKFLEIDNCEESSNGWMLLTSLNLLAAGDASLIQVMTTAAVPSTLVKCLYLFFDLPDIPDAIADANDGSDYTARERRILLQKVFVQVLVRLSSYPYPAEELARMDDLTLLFSAITSQCPAGNAMWRKSAAEVLTTLSRHGLSDAVVNYIHAKGCVALCVDNIQRAPELQPLETVEMLVTLFCFLKDSADVSQVLVDDFRTAQGYAFIVELLLRLDADRQRGCVEAEPAIRNLVLMIASLCMCGHIELRPPAAVHGQALFQMQGFQVPAMSAAAAAARGGTAVRNVHAFQVLQTVFLKTSSPSLGCTLLDAISSVYHSDSVNYFILEPQNTLSQFAERLPSKCPAVQEKFFELLEFVVFQLNFVPCKELISLSILLKADAQRPCTIRCVRTLLNLLRFNAVFRDVYREVGLLEVLVTCLLRYAAFLQANAVGNSVGDVAGDADGVHDVVLANMDAIRADERETLGRSVLDALGMLLGANNKNANVFRESGGAKCIHEMVKYRHGRPQTLAMLRELILSVGGEDDMLAILSTMHSAPAACIELKIHILRALLGCLRDSHRTRTIFRKVGGFVYVTSVFVSLDGRLGDVPAERSENGESAGGAASDNVLPLLQIVCQTLATAMRFEPANAKFFQQEICNTSLCDTLRLLDCFTSTSKLIEPLPNVAEPDDDQSGVQSFFHALFAGNVVQPELRSDLPASLQYCCLIFRLLYDIALDNFDKPNMAGVINITGNVAVGSTASSSSANSMDPRSAVSTLNLVQPQPEPLIVHPGIVIGMLQLLPSVEHRRRPLVARTLQCYLAEVIKSLVRSERNQQIMCEAGMAGHLLQLCRRALSEEHNPLHASLQYVLERLAAQALQPTELREFLRLGAPLCCESPNLVRPYRSGGPVPLTRIKTLVSMTTPRDFRAHGSCTLPPFVEMDMSAEGFGCLYLPSIAPQSPSVGSAAGGTLADGASTVGGIGAGDRAFPPQTGLTYSTWFCVDKFSDPRTDPHCVRLLTIIRTVSNAREDNLVCLTVLLSARDKAIIVSTQETLVPHNVGEWEPEGSGDGSARIWCPDLLHEGQWHHLVVVLNRAVLKNSSFSLFLDGNHMHTQKLHYISLAPGAGTVNVNTASSVYSFIGTPPAWRRYSRLCWKQGVCHLIEDIVTPAVVSTIYALGPHYMGSLQAPQLGKQTEPLGALVAEERVVFGLNAKAMTQLTLAKIRKVYSKADNKAIAKQLGMSSHENATPIRILHNSAGHLAGTARSLGGIVVGYLGVRVFSPHPVSTMMDTVGGCNVLLGIIAMAQDVESLYAGVKALTCVVRSNRAAQSEMDRKRSYQTLAMFFKKKRNLLNSHILHLTFSLVGTVNSGQESSAIPNITAFQDLLCDLEVWHGAPNGLLRSLLEHLLELASESSEKRSNIRIMRELQLVCKLLHIIGEIQEPAVLAGTREILFGLLAVLLGGQPRHGDLLLFGQYVAAKLPPTSAPEKAIDLGATSDASGFDLPASMVATSRNIQLRNRCLQLLHQLLFTSRNTVNHIICDDISRILGLDWVLLFMQPHVHRTTVVLAMRMLVVMCANDALIGRFREALQNGGYLRYTEFVSQQHKIVLGGGGHPQMLAQQTGGGGGGGGGVGGKATTAAAVASSAMSSMTSISTASATASASAAASAAVGMASGAAASVSAVGASVVANVANSVVGQVSQTAAGVGVNVGGSGATGGGSGGGGTGSGNVGGVGGLSQLPTQIAQEVKTAVLHVPGFQYLEWLLPHHLDVSELYFLLTALIMGQPVKMLAADHTQFDLDRVWAFLWGAPVSQTTLASIAPKINLCPEAVVVLLAMVRTIVHTTSADNTTNAWLQQHPITIVQVLFSLYHNLPDFMPVIMSADVIQSLAAVLFPLRNEETLLTMATITDSEPNSCASTPTDGDVPADGIPQPQQSPSHRGQNSSGRLTDHHVRKFIIDFLRVICVDAMSLSLTGKTAPVIDLVLDASPEQCAHSAQVAYQTEILTAIMDHLLAADVLVGEQAALPIVPLLQSHLSNIAPNVFYMTARAVDKLWQGYLQRDAHDVFDFVIKLIAQAKRRSSMAALSLEQLHHSLNRVCLYLLSRPTETVAEQMAVLEALHKLTTHRLLIFGAGNHELDFIGCLVYCLLQLVADRRIVLDAPPPQSARSVSQTTWHIGSISGTGSLGSAPGGGGSGGGSDTIEPRDDYLNQHQGRNLIVGAAFRVWEELYVCKKPAIEEVFKCSLTAPAAGGKAPGLAATREQCIDAATRLWYNYVELERKASYRVPWELHSQIQSKIQKVTGGLTRLASRTKVKKEEFAKQRSRLLKRKAFQWTAVNVALVRDLWEMRCVQNGQMTAHTNRYVCQDWLQSERELIRERGLWGPVKDNALDKWMMDTTEGPHRMRKKTMRNDAFYVQYPYRPELEDPDNRQMKYKCAISMDSKLYFTYCQLPPRVLCEPDALFDANKSTDKSSGDVSSPVQSPTDAGPSLARAQSEPGEEMDEEEDEVSLISDNQTLLRMLEEQEKISYMFRCARIQGLDTTEGLLLFGKEHCYVVDGFTLIKNREIRDIDSLPSGAYDPIVPNPGGSPRRSITLRQCSKFAYEDIREVHKRRYLLQPIALEVFSGDGRNYLLSFPRKVRNKVYQRFMATATAINDSAQQSVAGQKRGASVEQTSGIFSSLIGETSVTQRWVRGEISNFQYLMHLNTLAGRSYNDLMQYPVFPWILADYESEELDLTNPQTFRNFARPMGAQSADRLEQFQKRYKEWDDPHGETPPYHYGTHYSSAMIVCSYLVRLEPFAQHFLRLQGGHFDLADRMFHSIKEAWLSASKFNMADVKELIPEFFYLPEFLANANRFDLGSKQNGETLGDVILPPWAKQDVREFIRVHRAALECDYVSQNLHQWIDLIFGNKQQGAGSVDAVNVFHHLFYEGNVDIYNIDDPLKKNATIGFINNFGQIPKQLFKKAHPSKKMNTAAAGGGVGASGVNQYQHHRHTMCETPGNPLQPSATSSAGSAAANAALGGSQSERLFFHNLDNLKPSLQPIKELKGPVGQIHQPDKTVLAVEQNKVLMAPLYQRYIAWGFADHSLRIGTYDSDRALFVCEAAAQNSGEILACACPNARTIVTAGTSSVVTVWECDLRRKAFTVKHSLHGHTDAVTCLAASPAYNVIVSGSRDGTAIVWDMARFVFVRQLRDHVGLVAAVSINELTGEFATCSATWLHVWSANGEALAKVNTSIGSADRMQQILCVAFSATREWDAQNVVITGSTDGVVRMWSMEYVQVPVEEEKPELAEEEEATVASGEKKEVDGEGVMAERKTSKGGGADGEEASGIIDLVKRMSISVQAAKADTEIIVKSGSESSLSEACDSLKESSKRFETERDDCSDDDVSNTADANRTRKPNNAPATTSATVAKPTDNNLNIPQPSGLMVKRGSLTSAKSLHEFKHEPTTTAAAANGSTATSSSTAKPSAAVSKNHSEDEITAKRGIRPSKSDTSLTESFVIVEAGGEYGGRRRNANALREGFKWQRQLLFRSKLTMHTAYDRKDNAEPASITALAVSKDHKTLYVGDARGRVYSWSVAEQPGRGMADHWLKDEGADQCVGCHVRFTLYERKHHCRNCGQVFCGKCSRFESEISRLRILKPVRVCQACYATLRHHSVES